MAYTDIISTYNVNSFKELLNESYYALQIEMKKYLHDAIKYAGLENNIIKSYSD